MTDLDALSALLAAAKTGNHADVVVYRHRILEAAPSLIEAARREAGLREALTRIWMMAGGGADEPRIGALQDRLLQIEDDARRALLHDNAGAGER